MPADETTGSNAVPIEPTPGATDAVDDTPHRAGLKRRTFLKAAALGSAIAGLSGLIGQTREGSLQLGPLTTYADDLSRFQCTANDVRIIGPGRVINEPCNCSGTFTATVEFTVENNAASARNCITLHLCPAGSVNPGDIILQGEIAGKTTQVMTATIQNYPCGAGLLCFGAAGQDDRGRCDAGVCCSTISWGVPGQDSCPPDRQITSKCRHQQICIQGRGATTVDCNTSTAGTQASCPVPCGETTTVRVCTTNAASLGPFTYALNGQTFGPTADTCHDFTVGPITANTTLTGTVTDKDGCAKSATVTLTTTAITVQLAVSGGATCGSGTLTFTASTGQTGCTYNFSVDGTSVQNTTANTYSYPADPDGVCHTVSVVATCGGCVSEPARASVTQCVTTTACTPA